VLVIVSGRLGAPTRQADTPTPTATDGGGATPTKHPALESVLVRLIAAENRTAFAADHDLRLRDGKVLVVIELVEGESIPGGFEVDVTSSHDELVQAYVPIDELSALAEHRNVSFVRTPRGAVEHDTTTQ
jgi:hypothetical protein